MSLKSLFGKDKKTKNISSLVSSQEKLDDVESIGYIDQFLKDRKRFKTHTNFFTASNFAAYGSLEEYYKSGIDRISNTYPYDGSLKERLSWYNDSSGFDLHLFENEYPRTNGYVKISDNRPGGAGWGSVTSTSGAYGNPATKEYIYIKGGPNVGNVYATASSQTSNLEINGRTGNTVEFWLKKTEYVSSKTEREVILDITTTGSVEGDHKYGRLTVELDSSDEDKSPFLVTYQSGSTGFKDVRLGHPQLYTSGSDSAWHHYAISLKNESSAVKAAIYVDGEPNKIILTGSSVGSLNTAMVGSIGALVAYKDELHAGSDSQPVVAHNAISFDGIDDVVVVSDQDAFSPTDGSTDKAFSISAWVYVGDVSADNGPFVAKSNNTIATRNEYIFKHGNGEVQFFLYDSALSAQGNAIRAQADAATLSDATWHHVVATYDGSTNASGIKIYTDASQTAATNDEAGTYVKLRSTATPLTFGATEDAGSANRIFEDRMADVVIFDKELSSAEVTEIYNTGKILEMTTFSAYSNIVSWFKMGDGDDTTGTGGIKDYVSGYNGTLTNDAAIITNSGIKGEVQRLQYPGRGYGKLSGSLDDFRYWKKERSSKDVGRFWFTQIGAGSNTDPANSPLGFYYKFNEGEVGTTTIDKTVLDYSGRVSNGQWVGYAGYGRYNNSAMVEASASLTEFKDPIIYQNHPLVSSFRQETAERGYAYDLLNASSMYYSYPDWIVDEDGESGQDLKKITQVVASYFDSLFLQIKDMGELRHLKYQDFDKKPHPFNNVKLQSMGLVTPELFMDASTLNNLVNRGEDKEFRQDTSDIKNFIYNNIHNNLESIFKSKGTEKAFRNLFRCFGVDDELIKINLYSTDSVYPIETSYQNSTVKTKYVNFADNINKKASVFQSIDGVVSPYRTADARGFMKGTNGLISDDDAVSIGLTAEAQIYLPKIYPISHPFHFASPLSSSVLGCHNVGDETDDTVLTWTSSGNDHSNFQLYVVKEKIHSRTAKFVLKSRNDIFEAMESDYIVDLYDSNRWNVAMRLASDTPAGSNITGSGNSYRFELYGAKTVADEIQDSFSVQRSITATNAKNFIKNSRRFYIGAERDGFEGALQHESDVKVANFRVWNTELSNDEINAHAIDPRSYGVDNPSRVSFPLADIGNTQLTKIDLLAINWNFANLTGSNSNGDMWINDVSSGSIEDDHTFGKLAPAIRRLHPGKGINFASATTSSVDVEYDQATRLQPFENVKASDMVKVVLNDDLTFTRETKPTDFFFSFEKSMYAAVTDEMLNFFAGINEFSNLIGAPVERFRPNYKGLSKLRQVFFSRIENSPDIERYTEYYKWLDSSLSVMIDQLVPASVAASEDIRNVIESHILERSKYYNKFPTMEFKSSEPVGQIRGINELTYDWQYGHAPINKGANNHCLWTKERAQRSTDILVSGSEAVDPDREIIRRVSITSVSGSTYATRRLSRPYRLSVEDQRHAKGGDNTFGNKKKRLFTGISTAHGKSYMVVTGSELMTDSCKDIINPSKKKKFHATADIAFTSKDLDINDVAPFTIYSSSLDPISGYQALLYRDFKKGVDITNIHSDEYGDDREVTLQSPFTERWVGGNQHRHQDLSGSLLGRIENKVDGRSRLEAFKILAQGEKLYVLPPNSNGITADSLGPIPVIDPTLQGAQMLREELAKRPVNIKNIATTTSSISLGNYNHIYDVVQYTSEDQRKDFLVDNLEQITSSNSTGIPGVQEFAKFARPVRKSVFKARFASPGGTEVSGDSRGGHSLDRATNQYSVYNSLNYRNLSVRGPLDFLNKIPQTGSTDSNSLVTNHKINSNPRHRRRLNDARYSGEVDLNRDNAFVQHPIPQNDYQYAWITASLVTGRSPVEIAGHLHSFTQASLGTATGSLSGERTYEFLTASNRTGANVIDFAGLNTYIQDDIDVATNTVTAASTYNLTGTIHHRQGPYGWPSWKQIRAGDSALGRYFRKNNLYSIPVSNGAASFRTRGNYSWPDNIVHRKGFSDRSVADSNYRFTEPPVSSNRLPITLRSEVSIPGRGPRRDRTIPIKKEFSFNNKITRFANDNLTKVLSVEPTRDEERKELLTEDLRKFDFTKEGAVAEYSIEIFPKEKNAYLERTRERTQYTADDFWKSKRGERTKTDHANSQGNTIPKLSVWPLDAHDNFDTTALKKTTDKLGSDGSGELFANYSIFHNNLTHPSASALFARPMPYQSTSSLPATLSHYDFRLAFSLHRKAQYFSDKDFGTFSNALLTAQGELGDAMDYHDGTGLVIGDVPPGFTNDQGDNGHAASDGVRINNDPDSAGSITYQAPIIFEGTRTAAGSITGEPGSYSHYRFITYTGSLNTNSILGTDRSLLINFHLSTGDSTSGDNDYGIRANTDKLPFYVQVSGSTSNGFLTVAKIAGTSDEYDRHANNAAPARFHSILVTSSLGDGAIVRFIAPTSDATTDGNWSLHMPTFYLGKVKESEQLGMSRDLNVPTHATLPEHTASVSTLKNTHMLSNTRKSNSMFVPWGQSGFSAVSFGKIGTYQDQRNEDPYGANTNESPITSDELGTYDTKFMQTDNKKFALVYSKDETRDHHLYGSQFFRTPEHASRNPFNFDNYEGFVAQAKLLAKDYSLVPEFRISEHMDYYINTIGGEDPFFACNDTFLKITGSSSPDDSSQDTFYEVYTHTDFVKHFGVVEEEMKQVKGASATKLKLECKAYKKFLPYRGFYPADRMTQLASEFSSSYAQFVTGGHWRNVLSPYYAPGIGFNTIKSGIAVDYPVIEPHEDRIYNQYGVIFQSASLYADTDPGTTALHMGDTNAGGPVPAGHNHTAGTIVNKLSKNRIEIGGASTWADILTGSSSPHASNKQIVLSCWIYLPKKHETDETGADTNLGTSLSSYGILRQKGVLASFGSEDKSTVASNTSAWKEGVHFGYWIGTRNASTNNQFGVDNGKPDVDRSYQVHFTCFGGDGKDFFAMGRHGFENTGDATPSLGDRNNAISASPGWNHVLLALDPDSIGATSWQFDGFKAYLNGQEYKSISHLTASSGFWPSTENGKNTAHIKLDGSRNCFLGNSLSGVKYVNDAIKSTSKTTRTSAYAQTTDKIGIRVQGQPSSANQTAAENELQSATVPNPREHSMLDYLKPSDFMMTEVVILNAFDEHMPEALSGYPSGKVSDFFSETPNINFAKPNKEKLISFKSIGDSYGPANPYTTLSSSFHKNIVGWYRPGNDGGLRIGAANGPRTNKAHVYNHANPLFSGKILDTTTGSANTYDLNYASIKYNHMTGTFYGFTDWTGSLYKPKYSDKYIQRWNGIADISNPAQYTQVYSFPSMDAGGTDLGGEFKTWYAPIGSTKWFDSIADISHRELTFANLENLSSSYCVATGSTRIPSFIVGTRHNFTDDASVPRIGSASFGTYHFTGSGPVENDPLYSQGWITNYQKNTGVRKVSRIPFEAIIDPALFTPEMKGDADGASSVALFYEVEPHPSSSLLGAFNRQRKYVGQNSHGQQTFKWSSALDKQHADDAKFLTDKNFHLGVAMNSSSVLAEFDLDRARGRKSIYSLASSNFYAESLNLFLDNKKGVTLRSADLPRAETIPGRTYQMSIELNAGFNRRVRRDNPMYNNPAAFGIPFDAGKSRQQYPDGTYFSRSLDKLGYGFSPYLPPHYDGSARAKYTFTPDEGSEYLSIGQILKDTTVEYYRRVSATGSISRESTGFTSNELEVANTVASSYNRKYAMHISESFNGLALSDESFVQSYDANGTLLEDRRSLVIQTKFECPTFDFGGVSTNQPRTEETLQHLPKIRGIWHQTGSYTSDDRPSVNIIKPSPITGVGDLSQLIGLSIEGGNRVGEMPEQVTIHEGVVAVPFKTFNNTRKFFNLPPEEVYQAVRNLGYSDYKLKTEEDRRRFREVANVLDAANAGRSGGTIPQQDATRRVLDDLPSKMDVRPSIQQMVRSMMRYNLPPQFNFLKYNDPEGKYIKPFAMYMFDFSVDLPKADIARIWQNVTPDIGLDNFGSRNPNNPQVISSRIVEHDLFNIDDLLDPKAEIVPGSAGGDGYDVEDWQGGLDKDTQWMVFKVKQKAEADYFRKKELDRLPDGHPEKKISVENDIFKYGFNWPYDYFSLVELVNLKATVGFTNKNSVIDEETARILQSRRDNE